jgi:hypothetical protein
MIRISLDLNGNRGALNLNFDCDDNNRGWDDQDRTGWGTRPAQGNDRNWDRQDDNQSWSNREDRDDRFGNGWHNWDSNTWDRNGNALTNWSGVREGRGPLRWQGHGSTNIQRVRVAAQRDGDTRITFIGPRTAVFTGRSYRRGDFVYVDLKTGFGQRVDGTAKISLSRRFGEFFKVTIEGRDRSGRLFEGTFDDWN